MQTSICAIIKDEQLFLKEWIDYHLSIGFDYIYLCEDIGSESHEDIVKPYDNVILIHYEDLGLIKDFHKQYEFYCHHLKTNPLNSDWIAFIDIDEFIYTDSNIKDFLKDYNEYPGVYLYWKFYNANGHIYRPDGLVQDNYTHEVKTSFDGGWKYKSIVNTRIKGVSLESSHQVKDGVNTCKLRTNSIICYKKAHIKHYFTKSWEDWIYRFIKRGDVVPGHRKMNVFFILNPEMNKDKLMKMFDEYRQTLLPQPIQ